MEQVLVSNPLVTTNTLDARRVYGILPINTHATDACVFVVYSGSDNSGKVIWRGSLAAVLSGPAFTPMFCVGVNGLYVTCTGGTGSLIIYYT